MVENVYQLVYSLNCDELDVLSSKEHMQSKTIQYIRAKKCGSKEI